MSEHEHRFQRLRDDVLFCECGEIRYVPPLGSPQPQPSRHPAPEPWAPWQPWPPSQTVPWIMPPNTTITYPNDGRMRIVG